MTANKDNKLEEGNKPSASSPLCAASSTLPHGKGGAHSAHKTAGGIGQGGSGSKRSLRLLPVLLAALVMLVGACMIAYPFGSDYLNKLEQAKVTQDLTQTIQQTPAEDLSAYMQQAREYNSKLRSGSTYVIDPFDPDAPTATAKEYVACLNLNNDGAMGQIIIPSIGVNLPITHGTEGDAMDHSVGHVVNTSLPIGGPSTHAVLAGHTGLPSAVIFDKLDQLVVGDYFIVQILGEEHAYRVTSTEVVLPTDTTSLGIEKGEDLITLVTCTPYGVNSHRLLVHAQRCDIPQDWLDRKAAGDTALPWPYESGSNSFPPFLIGVMIAAVVLVIVFVLRLIKRTHKKRLAAAEQGRRHDDG